MLERIEGRVPDLVVMPDGSFLVMHFFVVLCKSIQEIDRYQVVQEREDRLLIRLVGREKADRLRIEAQVSAEVDSASRSQVCCDFEWLSEIPLANSGKRRLIISEVSRSRLGF